MKNKAFGLLVLLLLAPAFSLSADTLRVAVASNFLPAAEQLKSSFESTTGHKLVLSSGSSGVLFAQISKGAPFDLFLSADSERPKKLEEAGFIAVGTRQTYAVGRLVWWQPEVDLHGLDALASFSGRLALANPRFAPYGQAAMQVIAKSQMTKLQLVRGSNVSQAFQFVDSGNADAALVPLSVLLAKSHLEADDPKYQDYLRIPSRWHLQIEQQKVVIKRSKNRAVALEFQSFLLSNESQSRIAKLGYLPN